MRQGWGDPVIHASTRSTRAPRRKIPTNHSMNPCLLPPFPHAAGCPGRTLSSPLILSQPHIQSTAKFCQPFPRRHSSQTRALLPFSAPASLLHSLDHGGGSISVSVLGQSPHPPGDAKSHKDRGPVSLFTATSSDTSTQRAQSQCPDRQRQG